LHPLHNFMSYANLSPIVHAFVSFIDSHSIPKSLSDVLSNPGWQAATQEEMTV